MTTKIDGSLPASLNVTVNPAGLAPGNYPGTITSTDAEGGTQTVTVTLVVTGISSVANPASLTFVAQEGGAPPATQLVLVNAVVNSSYTVKVNGAWLSVSAPSGGAPVQLTISANPAGLAAGAYSGSVMISLGSNTQIVDVTFIVSANPVVTTYPGAYIFNYFGGNPPLAPVILDVNVSSGLPQSFTLALGVPAWLQLCCSRKRTRGAVAGVSTPASIRSSSSLASTRGREATSPRISRWMRSGTSFGSSLGTGRHSSVK